MVQDAKSTPGKEGDFVMNIVLWVAQVFAALVFFLTGALKVVRPKERLVEKMHWAATWPPDSIKLLGLAEVAGAIGLVLAGALHMAPVLMPIAAVCLAVLMLGAVQTHRRFHESVIPPLVLVLVCVAIAAGRVRFGA
jgi:uncharacterized membrane protein YphA (DoxX/SURF4 family)